jgi:predicted alpha/beta-fold hydrolase
MVLKLAGEFGPAPPDWLRGLAAISPSIDFAASSEALNAGPLNRMAQRIFLRGLREIARRRNELDPTRFPLNGMARAETLREFDELITARYSGFRDAADYYQRASAMSWMPRIALPTLLVTAQDDPVVPFASFQRPEVRSNPNIVRLEPRYGGHVAFIGRVPAEAPGWVDTDRRWAENRAVQFCRVLAGDGTLPG